MDLIRYRTELTAETTDTGIRGHAAVFGQVATLKGGRLEQVGEGAFTRALEDSDVRALWNHDPSKLLGTEHAGTLAVEVDTRGLGFDVELPDTSYAHDLRTLVDRGDLNGGSFGFIPDKVEMRSEGGHRVTTHTDVARLVDVSVVTFPAYEGAGVALRSIDLLGAPASARSRLLIARHRARTRSKS